MNSETKSNFVYTIHFSYSNLVADPNYGCDPAMNMTYSPAVFDCLPTCMEPGGPKNCQQEVTSGCKCAGNEMFYENGKCIPPTECGYVRRIDTPDGYQYEYFPVSIAEFC